MTAKNPVRRSVPAKELARQFGVSERTVRRLIAEPINERLARAAAHRAEALQLREVEGLPYAQIAEQMGVPLGTAKRLVHTARKRRDEETKGV